MFTYFEKIDPGQIQQFAENSPSVSPNSSSLSSPNGKRKGNQAPGYLVLVAETELENIPIIQEAFGRQNIKIAGAVFPELIYESEFKKGGVLFVLLPHLPEVLLVEDLTNFSQQSPGQIDEVIELVKNREAQDKETLFMIFDAMVSSIASILEYMYFNILDKVYYIGANAGSETFQSIDCLFDSSRVIKNGALMFFIEEGAQGYLEHGFIKPDEKAVATSSVGNKIISIDWKPAFDVYKEIVKNVYDIEITHENFYQYSVHFPFGMIRPDNTLVIRIPVSLDESGALFCVGEVPPGSILTLINLPDENYGAAVQTISERINQDESSKESDVLLCYCAGRRMHMGEKSVDEIRRLDSLLNDKKVAGALTLGELGNMEGLNFPLFQNATIVCLPIG